MNYRLKDFLLYKKYNDTIICNKKMQSITKKCRLYKYQQRPIIVIFGKRFSTCALTKDFTNEGSRPLIIIL